MRVEAEKLAQEAGMKLLTKQLVSPTANIAEKEAMQGVKEVATDDVTNAIKNKQSLISKT